MLHLCLLRPEREAKILRKAVVNNGIPVNRIIHNIQGRYINMIDSHHCDSGPQPIVSKLEY